MTNWLTYEVNDTLMVAQNDAWLLDLQVLGVLDGELETEESVDDRFEYPGYETIIMNKTEREMDR